MPRTILISRVAQGKSGRPEPPYIAESEHAMNFIACADDTVRALAELANQYIAAASRLRREALRLGSSRRSMTDSALRCSKKRIA